MQRPTHEYDSSSWGSIVTFQLLYEGYGSSLTAVCLDLPQNCGPLAKNLSQCQGSHTFLGSEYIAPLLHVILQGHASAAKPDFDAPFQSFLTEFKSYHTVSTQCEMQVWQPCRILFSLEGRHLIFCRRWSQ